MDKAKLQILRTQINGQPAVEIVVRNANASLRAICDRLGILPTIGISNRRSIICASAAEVEAARAPLRTLFDNDGNYIGE